MEAAGSRQKPPADSKPAPARSSGQHRPPERTRRSIDVACLDPFARLMGTHLRHLATGKHILPKFDFRTFGRVFRDPSQTRLIHASRGVALEKAASACNFVGVVMLTNRSRTCTPWVKRSIRSSRWISTGPSPSKTAPSGSPRAPVCRRCADHAGLCRPPPERFTSVRRRPARRTWPPSPARSSRRGPAEAG